MTDPTLTTGQVDLAGTVIGKDTPVPVIDIRGLGRPPVREQDFDQPSMDGAWPGPDYYAPREVQIDAAIKTPGNRATALDLLAALQQPAHDPAARLSSAALDDTSLEVRDTSGSLRAIVGQQPDGTTAVNVVNGPTPPQPTTPVIQSVLGGVAATWDGSFTDDAVLPLDFARVEVHASTVSGFTPVAETLQNTIETPQGATVTIPTNDPVYVRLVTRNTSGTPSTPSTQNGPVAPALVVADEIPEVLTGKVIQTGTTGRRVVISPDAGGDGEPGIALHSGHPNENLPGILSSTTINFGSGLQPETKLEAPVADSGGARLHMVSPAGSLGGNWKLDTNDTRSYCFIEGAGGANTGTSTIKMFTQDGTTGPSSLIEANGQQILLQRGLNQLLLNTSGATINAPLTANEDVTLASGKKIIAGAKQTPSYEANFSGGSPAAARYAPLTYRITAEGMLHVVGHFRSLTARAAGAHTAFVLPVGYRPAELYSCGAIHVSSADAWKTAIRLNVDNTGSVGFATTVAIAANDAFYINTLVPLT
ncbi:hypothetical protein [Streptomyces roseoviridis]|uniref:Minor tail protein n=1 Tax=Streptomyces roseoviridis TaxID=67361 RepID=A0ABV5QYN2_9ACTN